MPRRRLLAGLAAAGLAVAACSGGAPAAPPAHHVERPHYAPMRVTPSDTAAVATWPAVDGADHYVLTRTGSRRVEVRAPAVTSHRWNVGADATDLTDLTKARVAPHVYTVTALQGRAVLHRFSRVQQCPQYLFVAARGSGQNGTASAAFGDGLGDRGAAYLARLRHDLRLADWQLPAIGVDYPAQSISFGKGLLGLAYFLRAYDGSVSAGVADAVRVVRAEAASCRNSRFVLFGYSQGAQVMGSAYAALPTSVRARVATVVLFADPRYRPGDPAVTYLPDRLSNQGILGARGELPAGRTVVQSWCWNDDAVCQRPPHGLQMHGTIYDEYEVAAAAYTARLLR